MTRFFRKTYHIIVKSLAFLFFGLGGVFFGLTVGPLALLAVGRKGRANDFLRSVVSNSFLLLYYFLKFFRVVSVSLSGLEKLIDARGMVICANHPTLLDAVFLIGLTPGSDCVVKSSHWRNPFTMPVVSRLYIPNSLHGPEMIARCGESLEQGHNLILFPEGTRTDFSKKEAKLSRSAAQIALINKKNILPVKIEVNSPKGLGKHDSFFSCPENFKFEYRFDFCDPIAISSYEGESRPLAARRLTDDIKAVIFP